MVLLNFFFFLEQKKVKIKKPKPEFPLYTPLESTYIQSYDHGTSIEEIEEQMDDWILKFQVETLWNERGFLGGKEKILNNQSNILNFISHI